MCFRLVTDTVRIMCFPPCNRHGRNGDRSAGQPLSCFRFHGLGRDDPRESNLHRIYPVTSRRPLMSVLARME